MCAWASIVKLASSCASGEERDVAVQYVYLLPFLVYEGDAAPYGEAADDGASAYVASTVTMASLVFCASDSMSIFLYFYDFIFLIWA